VILYKLRKRGGQAPNPWHMDNWCDCTVDCKA